MPYTPTIDKIIQTCSLTELWGITGDLGTGWFYTTDKGKEGFWYYDPSDISSSDDRYTVIVTGDTNPKRIKRVLTNSFLDASIFGISYISTVDQSGKLQDAINICALAGIALQISGTIQNIAQPVYIPSDSYIFSENGGGIKYTNTTQNKNSISKFSLVIDNATNVVISGIHSATSRTDSNFCCFIYCRRSHDVIVENCHTTMSIIHMDSKTSLTQQDVYNTVTISTYNITVRNCTAIGYQPFHYVNDSREVVGIAAVLIEYCRDILVEGNRVENCAFGVQWWGGNSNPNPNPPDYGNGAITNERKCKNITVTNNIVYNGEGGIWGSMGENVIVSNNKVERCEDICIDFEGCFNAIANGNFVKDGRNGNLTTFFYNRNIVFSNNIAVSERPDTTAMAKIYNSTVSTDNDNISFEGNTFRWIAETGIAFFYIEPCNLLVVRDNTFVNTFISTIGVNQGDIIIEGNNFSIKNNISNNFSIINIDGQTNSRNTIIKNNFLLKDVEGAFTPKGIKTTCTDFNTVNRFQIENNTFMGFGVGDVCIDVYGNSPNSGIVTRFFISNNILDSGSIIRHDNSSRNSLVIMENNKTGTYGNYPNSLPTQGLWDAGQRIWRDTVDGLGTTRGWICKTTGVPGVFTTIKNGS